jgi:hypothetical protein
VNAWTTCGPSGERRGSRRGAGQAGDGAAGEGGRGQAFSFIDGVPDSIFGTADDVATALLPVVDRIATARAAAELRAAADWIWDDEPQPGGVSAELHARADALDPS